MAGLFGLGNPFHNDDLVSADNVITRDEMGENPGYDEKGPTEAGTLAGDWSDDDGQALDDALTPSPQGITGAAPNDSSSNDLPTAEEPLGKPDRAVPVPFGHAVELTDQDKPDDVVDECTRMLFYRVSIGSGFDPQMLFPRDPNRKHLIIIGDDNFQMGSDKSNTYAAGIFPAGLGIVLDKHTGALWVYNTSAATGSYVNAWTVTS